MVKKIALFISIIIVIVVAGVLFILSNIGVINLSPQYFQVNVSVGNSPPVIEFVGFTDNVGAVYGGMQKVPINFSVSDLNGAGNLADNSARVEIFNTGVSRVNSTCSFVGGDNNLRNYTCEVGMWYFDPYGQYIVNVTINDKGGLTAENSSKIFSYSQTPATPSLNGLTWPAISVSNVNVNSSDNPLVINNTGNVNFTIVNLTAYDLPGYVNSSEFIYAGNFSVSVTVGDCSGGIGDIMSNDTGIQITNGGLPIGNLSIIGNAQEELYFCLKGINPGTSSQAYSTSNGGTQWKIDFQE